mmetsp:Transcript_8783/g.15924  ORF Transcript_8783/g.15924 Transcript_8783/m.15924 type:complete len:248 (-) Transcript_8783:385-1128(-)
MLPFSHGSSFFRRLLSLKLPVLLICQYSIGFKRIHSLQIFRTNLIIAIIIAIIIVIIIVIIIRERIQVNGTIFLENICQFFIGCTEPVLDHPEGTAPLFDKAGIYVTSMIDQQLYHLYFLELNGHMERTPPIIVLPLDTFWFGGKVQFQPIDIFIDNHRHDIVQSKSLILRIHFILFVVFCLSIYGTFGLVRNVPHSLHWVLLVFPLRMYSGRLTFHFFFFIRFFFLLFRNITIICGLILFLFLIHF